jgi:hypothetical protein
MPLLKEYVATGAPVAALFSNIAQNHGVMWGALKGSLALLVRRFVNIVRIWRTETLDELYKVNEENQESIDNITRKYQDIFDKSDAMHNQQFGALSFVMHPGAAMAKTLLYSPIKNMTKEETQQFMRKEFLGLDTFDSLKPFIQPSKDVSPDPYTTAQFDADGKYTGKMTTTYLKPNPDFNPLINRAIEAVGKIFGESKVSRLSLVREATAPQEMEGIQYVIDLFQESGAFDQIMTTGEKLIDEREKQISELLGSAPQTIEYLAKIISSEDPDSFENNVEQFKATNKILKNMDPTVVRKNLDGQLPKMRKNEELIENLKKELGKDEITDDDLRIQAFKEAKIEFNNNLVEILEDYYEQVRKIIVGDTTPEGLEMMQKTPTGKRYADLINNSMKLLDNSLTSLGNVAKSNV